MHIAEFVDSPSSPNTIPKLAMGWGLMGGRHRLQALPLQASNHAVNGGVNVNTLQCGVAGTIYFSLSVKHPENGSQPAMLRRRVDGAPASELPSGWRARLR